MAAKSIDAIVGTRVRAARLEAGISEQLLAGYLGLTVGEVQRFESGIDCVFVSDLISISQLVGKPPEWFFEPIPNRTRTAKRVSRSIERKSVSSAFAAVSDPDLRAAIIALVGSLDHGPDGVSKAAQCLRGSPEGPAAASPLRTGRAT